MKLRTVTASLAVVIAAGLPASAYAVNVSSDDGSGTFGVTSWITNGANVSGSLKSTYGSPVYQSGKVVFNFATDDVRGRWSSNTSSTSSVTKSGSITSSRSGRDGVSSRICRDRNLSPDPCGGWSTNIMR